MPALPINAQLHFATIWRHFKAGGARNGYLLSRLLYIKKQLLT